MELLRLPREVLAESEDACLVTLIHASQDAAAACVHSCLGVVDGDGQVASVEEDGHGGGVAGWVGGQEGGRVVSG